MTRTHAVRKALTLPAGLRGLNPFSFSQPLPGTVTAHLHAQCALIKDPAPVADVVEQDVAIAGCPLCQSTASLATVGSILRTTQEVLLEYQFDFADTDDYTLPVTRQYLDPKWDFAGASRASQYAETMADLLDGAAVPDALDASAWVQELAGAVKDLGEQAALEHPQLRAPEPVGVQELYLVPSAVAMTATTRLYQHRPVRGWRIGEADGAALFLLDAAAARHVTGSVNQVRPRYTSTLGAWAIKVDPTAAARLDAEESWRGLIEMIHDGRETTQAKAQGRWDAALAAALV